MVKSSKNSNFDRGKMCGRPFPFKGISIHCISGSWSQEWRKVGEGDEMWLGSFVLWDDMIPRGLEGGNIPRIFCPQALFPLIYYYQHSCDEPSLSKLSLLEKERRKEKKKKCERRKIFFSAGPWGRGSFGDCVSFLSGKWDLFIGVTLYASLSFLRKGRQEKERKED